MLKLLSSGKFKIKAIVLCVAVLVVNWMLITSSWKLLKQKTETRLLLKLNNSPNFNEDRRTRIAFLNPSRFNESNVREKESETLDLPYPNKGDLYNDAKFVRFSLNDYRQLSKLATQHVWSGNNQEASERGIAKWGSYTSANKVPFTPTEVQGMFSDFLPWWEVIEMNSYPEIWYAGVGFPKPIFSANESLNFDFAYSRKGKRGKFYEVNNGDHVAYRYIITNLLGKGTYGTIVKALDVKTNQEVAIKIFSTNTATWKSDRFTREVNMMAKISRETKDPTHFPTFNGTFIFRNHICAVQELLGQNFQDVIKRRTSLDSIRIYAKQMIESISVLHTLGVLHMDLKLTNFALGQNLLSGKENPSLKLFDFGLSCIKGSRDFGCYSDERVQTPDYECPEVNLKLPYDKPCDVFDIGIILLTAATGKRHFRPKAEMTKINVMVNLLGQPPEEMLKRSSLKLEKKDFEINPDFPTLKEIVEDLPYDLADLIIRLLKFDPYDRISADEARFHSFVKDV